MSLDFSFIEDKKVNEPILINVGCLMDIPTGNFVIGAKGETIINGGLSKIFSIAGTGNNFKSTILNYFMLSAASKVKEATDTFMLTYDTEINIAFNRLIKLTKTFNVFKDKNIITGNPEERCWKIANKDGISGDKFIDGFFEYCSEKHNDKNNYIIAECFLDVYTKKPRKILKPSFLIIDSLTELESISVQNMLSSDIDSSDTNTYAMKESLFKTKFFKRLPTKCEEGNVYFLSTVHTAGKVNMGNQYTPEESKKNNYLRSADAIKGASNKIFFLTTGLFQAQSAKAFYNQGTKAPEYPKDPKDIERNDLNIVQFSFLRNKTGPSGIIIDILVSQVEGVLPTLTEFHYIKSNKIKDYGEVGFGIDGSLTNYYLQLYPTVKDEKGNIKINRNMSRTTVRNKIDTDPKLRRAINITAELLQLENTPDLEIAEIWCSPKELYNDLINLGYDWDILLDTRGYWTFNQYSHPVNFLSTIDLLKIRKGLYKPYWYKGK